MGERVGIRGFMERIGRMETVQLDVDLGPKKSRRSKNKQSGGTGALVASKDFEGISTASAVRLSPRQEAMRVASAGYYKSKEDARAREAEQQRLVAEVQAQRQRMSSQITDALDRNRFAVERTGTASSPLILQTTEYLRAQENTRPFLNLRSKRTIPREVKSTAA